MSANFDTLGEHWTTIHGLSIHYWEGGAGEKTILLIHGGGSDHALFSWKYALPALSRSFHVFAPDLPGYGLSDSPANWEWVGVTPNSIPVMNLPRKAIFSPPLSPENPFPFHIHFVAQFLKVIGITKVSLVGISMGGGIALGAALAYPDMVERLVLVDSYGLTGKMIGGILTYRLSRMTGAGESVRRLLQRSRTLVRWGLRSMVYRPSAEIYGELVDDAWQALRQKEKHPAWMAFQLSEVTPGGYRSDFSPFLPQLPIPTLLIHGEKDRLIPLSVARKAQQRLPHGKLWVVPRCGHLPPREKPEMFVQTVRDFLWE